MRDSTSYYGAVGFSDQGTTVNAVYRNTDHTNAGGDGLGLNTVELQSPTGYTGIYAEWNVDLDGDGTADDPWDFGTSADYPALKADGNNDGVFTVAEFPGQHARTPQDYDADNDTEST